MMIELDERLLAKNDYNANESFKMLRTNILFCGDDTKVIGFTSATSGEGRSEVSLNLAVSLAQMGKKVIYIDADLRGSMIRQQHRIKGIKYGFSHFLSGIKKFGDVAYTTNIENLHMILAGPVPPNPSELLGSRYMKVLIENLREAYDYIIIDASSVENGEDARMVAREVDGMILVMKSGEISYRLGQNVVSKIKETGCRILGVVLNQIKTSDNRHYGKYYAQYSSEKEKEMIEK